jgi:calcineurin-like phosphoesterase family protein
MGFVHQKCQPVQFMILKPIVGFQFVLKNNMKTWVISDTHWRHVNIVKYTGRHVDYEKILRQNWIKAVDQNDLVIHLGDVIFGQDKELHLGGIMEGLPGKKVLCRGNHDLKPADFYMARGFDIVTDYFVYENIAFSHAPLTPLPYQTVKEKNQAGGFILKPVDVNIHGHFS